jgi:hypothetical protein
MNRNIKKILVLKLLLPHQIFQRNWSGVCESFYLDATNIDVLYIDKREELQMKLC